MPVNKTGSYSGRFITKAQMGPGQDEIPGPRTTQGQPPEQMLPQPPRTTGSAPTFQNGGNGNKPA